MAAHLDKARALIIEKLMSTREIAERLGVTRRQCLHIMRLLSDRNDAFLDRHGPVTDWRWGSLRAVSEAQRKRANYHQVRLPDRAEWLMPAPTVSYVDGVKITRQAAPPGRFDVQLAPGTGVISQDWRKR